MPAGIALYAAYVPYWRIRKEEYQKAWGACHADMMEKTVADVDEDALTMAVAAGRRVLGHVDPGRVGVLACASTTFPYAEKASAPAVAAALGLPPNVDVIETGACAACGAQALVAALELMAGGSRDLGLVLVADNPAARPGDEWEHALGAGAAALLLTREDPAVTVGGWTSRVRESLGSRLRLQGEPFLRDVGVRALAYDAAAAVAGPAVQELCERLGTGPSAYRHAVFTQSGARQVEDLARALGFTREQLTGGLLFRETGDTGAASAFLGLCAVLDDAGAGERVMLAACGSGAAAVAVDLAVRRAGARGGPSVRAQLDRKGYVDYVRYLKLRGHIL